MIENAFLSPVFEREHPEDLENIGKLKDEIKRQIKIEESLLPIHDKYKAPALQALHDVLVEKFQQTKQEIDMNYNLDHTQGFRVRIIFLFCYNSIFTPRITFLTRNFLTKWRNT